MSNSKKELQPFMDEILNRKEELVAMPPRHNKVSANTLTMQLTPWRKRLIEMYAQSVVTSPEESKDAIEKWGTEVSGLLVKLELPLDVGLSEIAYYRNTIGEIVRMKQLRRYVT
ncbi:hypothetical protein [Bacillus sp. JCM 19041]|uniref:hypothetical protein n=1 Tax=Bacillus sp. JCM 19041 TaxID=1460637 RepID=UPI000A78C2CB